MPIDGINLDRIKSDGREYVAVVLRRDRHDGGEEFFVHGPFVSEEACQAWISFYIAKESTIEDTTVQCVTLGDAPAMVKSWSVGPGLTLSCYRQFASNSGTWLLNQMETEDGHPHKRWLCCADAVAAEFLDEDHRSLEERLDERFPIIGLGGK